MRCLMLSVVYLFSKDNDVQCIAAGEVWGWPKGRMLHNSCEAVRLLQSATQFFSIVFSKSFLLPSALALLCDVRVLCL